MPPANTTVQDFFWDDLLEFIDERRVIPIIGAELVTVPDGAGGEAPLTRVLAVKLAERLRVPADDITGDDALHQVVSRYVQRGGRREDVYPRLRAVMKEIETPVPPLLRELARIRHFNVFVTTTFDSLLTQAIDEERFGGAAQTTSLAYAPNHLADLPPGAHAAAAPTVFHLFGKLSASPDYVITEDDSLEFFTAMLSDSRKPGILLDELKSSHLLLLGNTFPDWLTRFFIRMAKCGRLSSQREELEVVAGGGVLQQPNLVLFLRNFSYRTQVFEQGAAADFVRELAARYAERHPPTAATPATSPAIAVAATTDGAGVADMKPGSVFLSYASGDLPAVQRIHAALEAAGVEVWFDKRQLQSGDDFDATIKRHIRACSYFLPVISAGTQTRHEAYFRLEWDLAVERSRLIAETIPFILPIAIDPLNATDALVPERFRALQWTPLPGGAPTPEFVERMVRLIRDHRKRERGLM
ncbi:MAG TPA: toll/interleukin-1 receptor domain-containing protein [Opitutaceae bacterium]